MLPPTIHRGVLHASLAPTFSATLGVALLATAMLAAAGAGTSLAAEPVGLAAEGRTPVALVRPDGTALTVEASLEVPLQSIARPGARCLLWLHLTNYGPDLTGFAEIQLGRTVYRRSLDLPEGARRRLSFFPIPYEHTAALEVRIVARGISASYAGSFLVASPTNPTALILVAMGADSLRQVLERDFATVSLDVASDNLGDLRFYDPVDLVALDAVAFSTLTLPARHALTAYLHRGNSVLLILPPGAPEPFSSLGTWQEHLAARPAVIERSPLVPGLAWLPVGRGRLLWMSSAILQDLPLPAREHLREVLLVPDARRARAQWHNSIEEHWPGLFPRAEWSWGWRSRWMLAATAYVLATAGFLMPVLRQRVYWQFFAGGLAAAGVFAIAFLFALRPPSAAILQSTGIAELRSGSAIALLERRVEVFASARTSARIASGNDLRPVYASWTQLSQSALTALEGVEPAAYRMHLVRHERRWFRLLEVLQLDSPLRAELDRRLADGSERWIVSISDALPTDLWGVILYWRGRATAFGELRSGEPAQVSLQPPHLSPVAAMNFAIGEPISVPSVRLFRDWERRASAKAFLVGWASPTLSTPFTGRWGDSLSLPVLWAVELEEDESNSAP